MTSREQFTDPAHALAATSVSLLELVNGLLAPHVRSHASRTALLVLWRHGQVGMTDLADRVGISRATVTTMIDRLAERGLVERVVNHDDSRKKYVRLTSQAAAALRGPGPLRLRDRIESTLESMTVEERQIVLRFLARVGDTLEEEDGAPPVVIAPFDDTPAARLRRQRIADTPLGWS